MKLTLLALVALALPAFPEDYACGWPACIGRITEDGEVHDVLFRKGDMVSTDAGWSVSTDDGWVKIKVGGKCTRWTQFNVYGMRVAYLSGFLTVVTNVPTYGPPKAYGSFAAAVPVSISLIGL